MGDTNWTEIEALHDVEWQHMANVLHEVSKVEKNPDIRQALIDLEKQILEIARLVASLNAADIHLQED